VYGSADGKRIGAATINDKSVKLEAITIEGCLLGAKAGAVTPGPFIICVTGAKELKSALS